MLPELVRERLEDRVFTQRLFQGIVVFGDAASFVIGLYFGWWLRFDAGIYPPEEFFPTLALPGSLFDRNPHLAYVAAGVVMLPIWMMVLVGSMVYEEYRTRKPINEVLAVVKASGISLIVMMSLAFLYRGYSYSRMVVFTFFVTTVLLTVNWRLIVRRIQRSLRAHGLDRRNFLMVGADPCAQAMVREALSDPGLGYGFLGYILPPEQEGYREEVATHPVFTIAALDRVVAETGASDVFICLPDADDHTLMGLVAQCDMHRVRIRIASELFDIIAARDPGIEQVNKIPIIELRERSFSGMDQFLKRGLDVVVAGLMLVILAPVMAIIAVAVRVTSSGPAIFAQKRVGFRGEAFTIFKFRTMYAHVPRYASTPEQDNDPRVTPVGRFLRKTSLDELPQLWNVLRGDMSLVGPRPEMPQHVENYQPWERTRLDVVPGLTGMWQVHGRSDIPLQENIEYDLYYVRNQSLTLDFKILIKTVFVVLYGKGAY